MAGTRGWWSMNELAVAVTLVLGGVLIASGFGKIQRGRFTADLARYQLLPPPWVPPLAGFLPIRQHAGE